MKKNKSFLEELEEHKKETDSRRRGVVAVLARREDIEQGIEAGYTLNDIYTVLSNKGQMPVTYSAFVKLVRKYIKSKEQPETETGQETERLSKGAKEALKNEQQEKKPEREPKGVKGSFQDEEKKKSRPYNPDNHDPKKLW